VAARSPKTVTLGGPDLQRRTYSARIFPRWRRRQHVSFGGFDRISLWELLGDRRDHEHDDRCRQRPRTTDRSSHSTLPGANTNATSTCATTSSDRAADDCGIDRQIDPNFVGSGQPTAFVAFRATGGALLSAPQLVIPNGRRASSRQNLTNLQLSFVPPHRAPVAFSSGVTVSAT